MEWQDNGIVLSLKNYGERSGLLEVLTLEHGRHLGIVRDIRSQYRKGSLQAGNTLQLNWRARISEHLGSFTFDVVESRAAKIMNNKLALVGLQTLVAYTNILPERESVGSLYKALSIVLDSMSSNNDWLELLIKWEMGFLAELGFGIDISKCVVSLETDNLIYVSPKSGKAVSKQIGNPYKDKLLKLPSFLIDNKKPSKIDVINGFLLTGFFLNKDVYEPLGLKMPNSRDRIVTMVRDSHLT